MSSEHTPLDDQPTARHWFKSSYSGGAGAECVEVATLGGGTTAVRDSKDPEGGCLAFGAEAWGAFIRAVREGGLE